MIFLPSGKQLQQMPQNMPQPFQPSPQAPAYAYPLQRPQPYPGQQFQRPMFQQQQQQQAQQQMPYPSAMPRPVFQPMAAHPAYSPQCQCGLRKSVSFYLFIESKRQIRCEN